MNGGARVATPLLLIVGALLAVGAVAALMAELTTGTAGRSGLFPEGSAYVVVALAVAAFAFVLTGAVLVAARIASTSALLLEPAKG